MSDEENRDIMRRPEAYVDVTRMDDQFEARRHVGEGLSITSHLVLDMRPRIELSWGVTERHWKSTLLIFHNTTGFCPTNKPRDLGLHGRLIIETTRNGNHTLFPEEGTHFFTCLLRRDAMISWFGDHRSKPVRFFIEVPSAKVILSRMKDLNELADRKHEMNLKPFTHEAQSNEEFARLIESRKKLERVKNPQVVKETPTSKPFVNPQIAAELGLIDALVEALFAKETKREEMLKSLAFQKLSAESKKLVLDAIDERLHPGELNARRERGQS